MAMVLYKHAFSLSAVQVGPPERTLGNLPREAFPARDSGGEQRPALAAGLQQGPQVLDHDRRAPAVRG